MNNKLLRICVVVASGVLHPSLASAVDVGQPAPTCALTPLAAHPTASLADLHGQVVYVDFWASWCPPCAKAFPHLNALQRDFAARGFAVLGVNVDQQAADALKFLDRRPAQFALAADTGGACPRAFGVKAMPSGYLVDRAGVVRQRFAGFRDGDEAELRAAITRLLDESPAQTATGSLP